MILRKTFILLFLVVHCIFAVSQSFAQRPQNPALLSNPQRNYTGNLTATDRNWFYLNSDMTEREQGGGVHPSIEFSDDECSANDIGQAVYVRGSQVTVIVRLKDYLNSPDPIVGNLTLSDAKFVIGSNEYSISVSGPSSVSVGANGGYQGVTLTFSGLPNFVAKGKLKLKSYLTLTQTCYGNPVGYIAWGNTATAALWPDDNYLTDQSPTGHQSIPWTDLLDYACAWAEGESGSTDVGWGLVFGMYWQSPLYYDQNPHWYFDLISGTSDQLRYHLSIALQNASVSGGVPMDCTDVSGFIQLLFQALGHTPSILRFDALPSGMVTKAICPIGSDATNFANYSSFIFGGHQILLLNGAMDPTIAQYKTPYGSIYENPPYDWSFYPYCQNFPIGYPSPVFGMVYGITPNSPNAPDPDPITPNTNTVFIQGID